MTRPIEFTAASPTFQMTWAIRNVTMMKIAEAISFSRIRMKFSGKKMQTTMGQTSSQDRIFPQGIFTASRKTPRKNEKMKSMTVVALMIRATMPTENNAPSVR